MAKVGETRHERIIIGLIVVLIVVELLAWLRPQPYRWTREETMATSAIELDGRYYMLIDSGELVDISEEFAASLRGEE